jgi:hypothetical protein
MCLIKPNKLQASSGVVIRTPSTNVRKKVGINLNQEQIRHCSLDRLLRRRDAIFIRAAAEWRRIVRISGLVCVIELLAAARYLQLRQKIVPRSAALI